MRLWRDPVRLVHLMRWVSERQARAWEAVLQLPASTVVRDEAVAIEYRRRIIRYTRWARLHELITARLSSL